MRDRTGIVYCCLGFPRVFLVDPGEYYLLSSQANSLQIDLPKN